jgi:hypothetical protein
LTEFPKAPECPHMSVRVGKSIPWKLANSVG